MNPVPHSERKQTLMNEDIINFGADDVEVIDAEEYKAVITDHFSQMPEVASLC